MRPTRPPCPDCGCIHAGDWTRAENLFSADRVVYRATFGGAPRRLTREQAMQDACDDRARQAS